MNEELEQKSVLTDELLSDTRACVENISMNIALSRYHRKRLYFLVVDQRIKDLEKKRGGNSESSDTDRSFDIESLHKYLAEYAKKSDLKDYCPKTESEDLSQRIS